jgi:tetratricopeptide (TPR) repeat protein
VTPVPTLPAFEQWGDLLMEQKQPAEALASYKRSMEFYPKRFNSLLGAARAASALGDEPGARAFYQELFEMANGGTRQAPLQEARRYGDARP